MKLIIGKYYKRIYHDGTTNDIVFKFLNNEHELVGSTYIWVKVVWNKFNGVLKQPYHTHIFREYPSDNETFKLTDVEATTLLI